MKAVIPTLHHHNSKFSQMIKTFATNPPDRVHELNDKLSLNAIR